MSGLLSVTSLLVVLFRVSPLTSPGYAVPAFLVSVLLSVASLGTLAFYAFWTRVPLHMWDAGQIITASLRQGALLGIATVLLFVFAMLGFLTWWIGLMIYAAFVLIELAINA